ncbi:CoA transferase [Sphingomonas sp. MMS24-JH45]
MLKVSTSIMNPRSLRTSQRIASHVTLYDDCQRHLAQFSPLMNLLVAICRSRYDEGVNDGKEGGDSARIEPRGVLAGVRVLDFGRYVASPCATILADFGADVIRVERRGGGEDRRIVPVCQNGDGALFLQVNRNKRAITLDPRHPDATEIRRRLIATADVVVVNVPDSALAAMGLGPRR